MLERLEHDVFLSVFPSGLKFLKRMHLSQVNLEGSGVTLSGIASLVSFCPHITSIRASHTRAIPPDQVSDDDGDAQ